MRHIKSVYLKKSLLKTIWTNTQYIFLLNYLPCLITHLHPRRAHNSKQFRYISYQSNYKETNLLWLGNGGPLLRGETGGLGAGTGPPGPPVLPWGCWASFRLLPTGTCPLGICRGEFPGCDMLRLGLGCNNGPETLPLLQISDGRWIWLDRIKFIYRLIDLQLRLSTMHCKMSINCPFKNILKSKSRIFALYYHYLHKS